MKTIKQQMVDIFKTYEYDWMNFRVENDDLTYHHIKKAEDGGERTIDNGALLTNRAHKYLHKMETFDRESYDELNEIFKEINNQKDDLTYFQRNKIQLLLLKYEIKNVDRIVKKREKLGKHRTFIAVSRRIKSQELL